MKTRALILKSFALIAVLATSPGVTFAATRPNVVTLLADDSGWGDYSISGNTQVRTPNIDSIARAGVSLDRFFLCAVCTPSRATLHTFTNPTP